MLRKSGVGFGTILFLSGSTLVKQINYCLFFSEVFFLENLSLSCVLFICSKRKENGELENYAPILASNKRRQPDSGAMVDNDLYESDQTVKK